MMKQALAFPPDDTSNFTFTTIYVYVCVFKTGKEKVNNNWLPDCVRKIALFKKG